MKNIAGNCPLCGGDYKFVCTPIDRQQLMIDENNQSAEYEGYRFVLTHSVASLLAMNGVPYKLGTIVGETVCHGIEWAAAKTALILSDNPRYYYLIEIKCSDCEFVSKRYFTDKIK